MSWRRQFPAAKGRSAPACPCPCVEPGAGFSIGSYCTGETHTDPWAANPRHCLLFYLLFMAKALPRQPWCFSTLEWRIVRHWGGTRRAAERAALEAPGTQGLAGMLGDTCTPGTCGSAFFLCLFTQKKRAASQGWSIYSRLAWALRLQSAVPLAGRS